MTDKINNRIFTLNLRIFYWKYLQEHVFLHGHGDYEKIRWKYDILRGHDYGPLTENNSNEF